MIPAEGGQLPVADFGDVPAVQTDGAAGGPVQSGQDIQEGGLARTGLAMMARYSPCSTVKLTSDKASTFTPPKRVE